MGRRGDSIWEHWTVFEQPNPKKMSMDKMKCNYCDTVQCRNTLRSKKHTVRCPGKVPEEVRKEYQQELDTILAEEEMGQRKSYVKQALSVRRDDGESSSMPRLSGAGRLSSGVEKRKAVELISDLLNLNEPNSRKKPLSQYTDEDFKREQRELAIRRERAEIRHMETMNELYERLISAADKVEPFLQKAQQLIDILHSERTARQQQQVPVEVVYNHQTVETDTDNTVQISFA